MIPELRLFGGTTLLGADGQPVAGGAAQPRRLAVLAVLADAWPAAVTRDRLIGLIWPEQDDAGARRLLTQALYELRRELGPVVRGTSRDLTLESELLRVDLLEFRSALAAGALDRAVAVHRAPLLDGFHLRGALDFERWTDTTRDEARRQLQESLETLVRREDGAGNPRAAARWAEVWLQWSPFDADAVLYAMDLHARAGNIGAALALAATYERRMRAELEVEPAAEVLRRVELLRARAPASDPSPRPAMPPTSPSVELPSPASATPPAGRATPAEAPTPLRRLSGRFRDHREWQRPRRILWSAISVAVVALVGIVVVKSRAVAPASPAGTRTLRIHRFPVRGDTSAQSIGVEVASILASSLDGAAGIQVVHPDSAASATVAGSEHPMHLTGEVIVHGAQLQLDVELRPAPDGSPSLSVSTTGPRDSVLALAQRLTISLLPTFYTGAGDDVRGAALARFTRADVLRQYLDGQSALRRGDVDRAYTALKSASELAPEMALLWYQRALAAEEAHRPDDADRSIATADARSAGLPERDRQLIHGYALWRAGDARAAEPIFRQLVQDDSRDRDAWFHLAEIGYHAGPLLGRPIERSRDAWRGLVALDSGSFPAVLHAVRLAARAHDTTAVRALLGRITAIHPAGAAAAEARVIAAYAVGGPEAIDDVQRELDAMPDYSLGFVQGFVAGMLERPDLAEPIARRLTDTKRPVAVQGEGHLALAQLALAQGRWRDASKELDLAAAGQPVAAAWYRGYFASLPFLELPTSARDRAIAALRAAPLAVQSAPLSLQLAVDAPATPIIHDYLTALLRPEATAGAPGAATMRCAPSEAISASTQALCADLRRGVSADVARREGRRAAALAQLDSLSMRVPYQFAGRSMFFARSRERFLHAELLADAGRLAEAANWYAAVPHGAWMDHVYLAPAHLRRGQLAERIGDKAGAAAHYRQVIALWRDHDADMSSLSSDAEAGLRRVTVTITR